MTSYNLNNLKIIEESLRLEMLEKERRRSSKSNEKKKKIETARLLETALQDARLRFKRGEYRDALIWFTKVSPGKSVFTSHFYCLDSGYKIGNNYTFSVKNLNYDKEVLG